MSGSSSDSAEIKPLTFRRYKDGDAKVRRWRPVTPNVGMAFRGATTQRASAPSRLTARLIGEMGMEAHFPIRLLRGRRRGIEQGHDPLQDSDDGCLVRVEAGREFLFQGRQLAREFTGVAQRSAHLHERAHHEDAHLHCLRTLEDSGRHDGAVLGESVGQRLEAAVALG